MESERPLSKLGNAQSSVYNEHLKRRACHEHDWTVTRDACVLICTQFFRAVHSSEPNRGPVLPAYQFSRLGSVRFGSVISPFVRIGLVRNRDLKILRFGSEEPKRTQPNPIESSRVESNRVESNRAKEPWRALNKMVKIIIIILVKKKTAGIIYVSRHLFSSFMSLHMFMTAWMHILR